MHHLRRIGLTFYARLTIPKDRWRDVGLVTSSTNGERREVVRTLETRDHREALKRRGPDLTVIGSGACEKGIKVSGAAMAALNIQPADVHAERNHTFAPRLPGT